MTASLPFTGERFVPGAAEAKGEMWYEHWHRYHYVLPLVAGKTVLDVACGEGYGSALLCRAAQHVTGVDISSKAVAHGRATYGDRRNLALNVGSCTQLPLADASVEVVVSFETIEHIEAQAAFLDEIKRVLKPDGLLILSSPNKAEYSDKRGFHNEFHLRELYRPELEALLAPRFAHVRWLSQRNAFVSLIAPEQADADSRGEALTVSQSAPATVISSVPALYYIVVAADSAATLASAALRCSAFTDAEEWAYNDYRDTYRGFRHYRAREQELEARCQVLQAKIEALEAGRPNPTGTSPSWFSRLIRRLSG